MEKDFKQLNILAVLTDSIGGRLTSSSIIDGFRALGHNVVVYDNLADNDMKIVKDNYDFIFGYDFTGIEFACKNKIKSLIVNYFSDVIEDEHSGKNWEKFYPCLFNDNSFTFYWDKTLCSQKKEEIKNLFYLPHFVNTDIYKNTNAKIEYDVMFAGRLDTDFRLHTFLHAIKSFPDLNFGWFAIEHHLKDALSRVAPEDKIYINNAYQGFIDNEQSMADAINASKIVINFNQQGVSSLNYRTIQSMACERLVLNDYRNEGVELFGDNFVYYSGVSDLIEKIRLYTENRQMYYLKTKNLRKYIESDFSHISGAQKIIGKICG